MGGLILEESERQKTECAKELSERWRPKLLSEWLYHKKRSASLAGRALSSFEVVTS